MHKQAATAPHSPSCGILRWWSLLHALHSHHWDLLVSRNQQPLIIAPRAQLRLHRYAADPIVRAQTPHTRDLATNTPSDFSRKEVTILNMQLRDFKFSYFLLLRWAPLSPLPEQGGTAQTSPAALLAASNKFLHGESLIAVAHNPSLCLFAPLPAAANAEPADPLPLRAPLFLGSFPAPHKKREASLSLAPCREGSTSLRTHGGSRDWVLRQRHCKCPVNTEQRMIWCWTRQVVRL